MNNTILEFMQANAMNNLYSGCVTPLDREILSEMPIPSDMVDPFASEEVKPLSLMNLTFVSLSGWIADAKKEKYYSERFVQLSKLVMKGVTTMARGLVTLHKRGEDLSPAPMQIDDLISVGSYHFRKSYLGVVQFSAKHPEIGERLLVNQLGWCSTLLRLFKTKEKLSENQKSEIRNQKLTSNEEGRMKNEELPDGNSDNSECLLHNSSLNEDSSLDKVPAFSAFDEGAAAGAEAYNGIDAIFAPAAFSAPRAYASLDKPRKTGSAAPKMSRKKQETGKSENEETILRSEKPETELLPEANLTDKDEPLPVKEETIPESDPAEIEETVPVSEETAEQSDSADLEETVPMSEEAAKQSDLPEAAEPLPMNEESIPQKVPPENEETVPQAEDPERALSREGPPAANIPKHAMPEDDDIEKYQQWTDEQERGFLQLTQAEQNLFLEAICVRGNIRKLRNFLSDRNYCQFFPDREVKCRHVMETLALWNKGP